MSIDIETTRRIARLARLKIPPQEMESVMGDLNRILGFVDQLNEVNVDGVEPLANVNDASLGWREQDIVNDGDKSEDILANAPARTADYFTVPKVIE